MVIETQSSYVTPVGGNVFADLGFKPEEAVRLKAKSAKIIAERIALKESLAIELTQWIDAEKLHKFTIDALVDMLSRIGKQVHLTVG